MKHLTWCALLITSCHYFQSKPITGTAGTGGSSNISANGGNSSFQICDWLPAKSTQKKCDIKSKKNCYTAKIVGGSIVPDNMYPWMVAIETESNFQYCGGSVIGDRFVLTAAHCQVNPGDVIHVGTNNLQHPGRRIPVVIAKHHPQFQSATSGYDVAVLEAASSLLVEPVLLGSPLIGSATAIGWGSTYENGPTTPILHEVTVPIWSDDACYASYEGMITDTMFCAGESGKDSCQGDSGGPLVQDGFQIGITSWGDGCARPMSPGVYTNVNTMISWILACAQ